MKKKQFASAVIIMTMFFLVFTASGLTAEESEPAILKKGPVPHKGIEFLGTNAITSYYGEYSYKGETVRLYYTDETVFLSEDWHEGGCKGLDVFFLNDSGGDKQSNEQVVAYRDKNGWTAFLAFSPGNEDICGFIQTYVGRQNYFLNIAREKNTFSFPAILEF